MNIFGNFNDCMAEISKRIIDERMDWFPEETKMLRWKHGGVFTEAFPAEFQREQTMGFARKPFKTTVRFCLDLDKSYAPALIQSILHGTSLYDGDKLFGEENAWKFKGGNPKGSKVDLWLED
jgi:hypothetical protein